jgi:hypothetical protein
VMRRSHEARKDIQDNLCQRNQTGESVWEWARKMTGLCGYAWDFLHA